MLTFDNRALRDVASAAPYDFLEILVNEKQYGGGGIFNDQATASVDSAFAEYVFVHEFGHHFAGLADEYYTSRRRVRDGRRGAAGAVGAERDRADGPTHPKWHDLVDKDVRCRRRGTRSVREAQPASPGASARKLRAANAPESEMDALFREERDWETKFLGTTEVRGQGRRVRGRGVRGEGPLPARRSTASCSRATRSASARSAGARSSASSTAMRVETAGRAAGQPLPPTSSTTASSAQATPASCSPDSRSPRTTRASSTVLAG